MLLTNAVTRLTEIKRTITAMDSEIGELDKQIGMLAQRHKLYVEMYEAGQMDEVTFDEQCEKIDNQICKLRARRMKLLSADEDERCIDELRQLREKLAQAPPAILEFDVELFHTVVERMTVEAEGSVVFTLHCGLKLREDIAWK